RPQEAVTIADRSALKGYLKTLKSSLGHLRLRLRAPDRRDVDLEGCKSDRASGKSAPTPDSVCASNLSVTAHRHVADASARNQMGRQYAALLMKYSSV